MVAQIHSDPAPTTVDRRGFLKGTAGVGLAAAVGGGPLLSHFIVGNTDKPAELAAKWVPSTCQGCTSWCPVEVEVIGGRAVKVRGNPNCLANHGEICPRPHIALQQLYDPDRIHR